MENAVNRQTTKPNRAQRRDSGPNLAAQVAPAAYTVPEFCNAHRISRALLYVMLRDGRGPRLLKAGHRTLITLDSAAEWRHRMEAASAGGAQ